MSDVSLEGMSQESIIGLAQLAKGLMDNPETRLDTMRLAKKRDPSLMLPEIDIPNQMHDALKDERAKLAALEQDILKERAERNVLERREALKNKHNLTDADVADVEKIMVEKGISSHETAAEFREAQMQAAKPTPFQAGFGSHQKPEVDAKAFGGNIGQWSRNEAAATIADIRAGRIKV